MLNIVWDHVSSTGGLFLRCGFAFVVSVGTDSDFERSPDLSDGAGTGGRCRTDGMLPYRIHLAIP